MRRRLRGHVPAGKIMQHQVAAPAALPGSSKSTSPLRYLLVCWRWIDLSPVQFAEPFLKEFDQW